MAVRYSNPLLNSKKANHDKEYFYNCCCGIIKCSPLPATLGAKNVSEDCKVGEFSAINLRSVGNIIFTQSEYVFPVGWKVLLNMSIKQK